MGNGWVCVPNHYNSFPVFIQQSVGARQHMWFGKGDITSDGRALLSSLPNEPIGLMGYSYGGLVSWWVSRIAPHRVRELVILGSIPQKRHIPRRLRWMCRVVPSPMMLWWRDENILSRLYSVCRDLPQEPPQVQTTWFLGKNDPYHHWQRRELPSWGNVHFVVHNGGSYPSEQEWRRFQKFS